MGKLTEKAAARPPKRCVVGQYYAEELDDDDRKVFDAYVEAKSWVDLARLLDGDLNERSIRRHADRACRCVGKQVEVP